MGYCTFHHATKSNCIHNFQVKRDTLISQKLPPNQTNSYWNYFRLLALCFAHFNIIFLQLFSSTPRSLRLPLRTTRQENIALL